MQQLQLQLQLQPLPQPQPQIAELLRTCVHPLSLLLRIAHIENVDLHDSNLSASANQPLQYDNPHHYAIKVVLSDGHLMIQALLHRKLTTLRDTPTLDVGDLLNIRCFQIKKAPRTNGGGQIVYLAIEDCTFLLQPTLHPLPAEEVSQKIVTGRPLKRKRSGEDVGHTEEHHVHAGANEIQIDTARPPLPKQPRIDSNADWLSKEQVSKLSQSYSFDLESMFAEDIQLSQEANRESGIIAGASAETQCSVDENNTSRPLSKDVDSNYLSKAFGARQLLSDDEDDDDFFETREPTPAAINQRRSLLKQLGVNASAEPDHDQSSPPQHSCLPSDETPHATLQTQPILLLPQPPFHTLRSLRNLSSNQPLPKKSYVLTTLAIISWAGATLVHRPASPFPPKRHIKVVDPSLASSRPPSRETPPQLVTQHRMQQDKKELRNTTFKPWSNFHDAVSVAVYLDAATFTPAPGTIALFKGLVLQRFPNGDITLNAYARLKDQRFQDPESACVNQEGDPAKERRDQAKPERPTQYVLGDNHSHWFITDHDEIRALGYGGRLDYYLNWWEERQKSTSNHD